MSKQNLNNKKTAGSKGVISVIVALSVLAIILTIGLSASSTISGELSLSADASESAKAYYAAETGIERAIYERFRGGGGGGAQPTVIDCGALWQSVRDAKYCLIISQTDPLDFNTISGMKTIGEFGSVRRSVQISF